MIDPGLLMSKIEESAREIDQCGRELATAIKSHSAAEISYEAEKEKALIEIHNAAKEKGEREPAQDLRAAMAHRKIDARIYGEYLLTKASADALRARLRALEASTSARQSLLATMREEARIPVGA